MRERSKHLLFIDNRTWWLRTDSFPCGRLFILKRRHLHAIFWEVLENVCFDNMLEGMLLGLHRGNDKPA